jgi:hypothetical protein
MTDMGTIPIPELISEIRTSANELGPEQLILALFLNVIASRMSEQQDIIEGYRAALKGKVIMPDALTAENGAKCALSGEFKEMITQTCDRCDGSGIELDEDDACTPEYPCDNCDGSGEVQVPVLISWTNIKDIYKEVIEIFGGTYAEKG